MHHMQQLKRGSKCNLQFPDAGEPRNGLEGTGPGDDSRTNQPSSSSRLVGAGNGAPWFSLVGRLTYPESPNGFKFLIEDRRPVCWGIVLAGSSLRRLQPKELKDSRKEAWAIVPYGVVLGVRHEARGEGYKT